jgi:flagellar M-ring protein FliF
LNAIVEFVRTLGAARLAAMGAVAVALVFFFVFIIARVSAPAMAPLFTELTLDDSARIVRELETQGIQYELKNDGASILIPKDRVARTRMRLAETGLPRGGNVGYEIFDRTDTLGTTSFVQNVNHVRALEGELSRTIRSIDRIASASFSPATARTLPPPSFCKCAARSSSRRSALSATSWPRPCAA